MADTSAQSIFAVAGEQLDLFVAPALELEVVAAPAAPVVEARRVFRVLGTTDDVTTCELCGRDELRGTVVLEVLDVEGNGTGELCHYGSACGAKAAGWSTREVVTAAKAADDARRAAEDRAAEARRAARFEAYAAHLVEVCGTADLWKAAEARGFDGVFPMRKHDRAAGVFGA